VNITAARSGGNASFRRPRYAEWPVTEAMSGFVKILEGELVALTKQGILN
jgi:hypothetical protein